MTAETAIGPLVDVIIPCYNHGRFLTQAVESILAQTYSPVRVTIVDDGSSDETAAVATSFGGPVQYVRIAHGGLSGARNVGIERSDGQLLLFLDADDYLAADAIAKHVEAARATPGGGVFYGSWVDVGLAGEPLTGPRIYPLAGEPLHKLLEGYCPPCHSLMVRREVFERAGTFDGQLEVQEDWDMWLRVAGLEYQFVPVPGALAMYRRYPGSMTRTAEPRTVLASAYRRTRENAGWHHDCDRCKDIVRRCMRDWRAGHVQAVKRELAAAGAGAKLPGAIWASARAVVRVPSIVPLLLRDGLRSIGARIATRSRAYPCDSGRRGGRVP